MSRKRFVFDNVQATLVSPTDETLANQARYMLRLAMIVSLDAKPSGVTIPQFTAILAHVENCVNFPFSIPSPLAHPDDIKAVWDIFLDSNPALWDALISEIELPPSDKLPTDYLDQMMKEFESMAKAGKIPPPTRQKE